MTQNTVSQYVDSLEQIIPQSIIIEFKPIDPFGDLSSYSQIVEGMG